MNPSGIKMIEYNVLVDQDIVEERTKGGVVLPDEHRDRQKHGVTWGRIVDMSPMAFEFDDWPVGEAKPKVGDRVFFAKHSGCFVTGKDDKEYRVVKDKDVVGVMVQDG